MQNPVRAAIQHTALNQQHLAHLPVGRLVHPGRFVRIAIAHLRLAVDQHIGQLHVGSARRPVVEFNGRQNGFLG